MKGNYRLKEYNKIDLDYGQEAESLRSLVGLLFVSNMGGAAVGALLGGLIGNQIDQRITNPSHPDYNTMRGIDAGMYMGLGIGGSIGFPVSIYRGFKLVAKSMQKGMEL